MSNKNINLEFIQPAKDELNNFQKSLNSIIASLGILNNHHT